MRIHGFQIPRTDFTTSYYGDSKQTENENASILRHPIPMTFNGLAELMRHTTESPVHWVILENTATFMEVESVDQLFRYQNTTIIAKFIISVCLEIETRRPTAATRAKDAIA